MSENKTFIKIKETYYNFFPNKFEDLINTLKRLLKSTMLKNIYKINMTLELFLKYL